MCSSCVVSSFEVGGTKKDRGCVECSSRVSRRSARKDVRCNGSQKGIQDFIALIYPGSRPSDCSYDNKKFRPVSLSARTCILHSASERPKATFSGKRGMVCTFHLGSSRPT